MELHHCKWKGCTRFLWRQTKASCYLNYHASRWTEAKIVHENKIQFNRTALAGAVLSTGVVIEQYLSKRARRRRTVLIRANSGWIWMLSDSCLIWFCCPMEEAVVWRCLFWLIMDKSRSFAHLFSPILCLLLSPALLLHGYLSCQLVSCIYRASCVLTRHFALPDVILEWILQG